jgi:hypothetical protein
VGVKPNTRGRKLRSCIYWQGALKQKSVKQIGRKKGLRLIPAKFLLEDAIDALLVKKFTVLHGARLFIIVLIKFLSNTLP